MFGHYTKVAWRNLLKYKVQSVISMVGLGVGLSCFTLCNKNIREIFMKDRRLPYLNSTYVLYSEGRESGIPDLVPAKIAEKLAEEFPEIEKSVIYYSLGEYNGKMCVVEHEDGSKTWREEDFIYSDSSFLNFYDFRILQGKRESILKQADALLLTPSAAMRIFGTTDVVGRTFMDVDDFQGIFRTCQVAGIMEEFPRQTCFDGQAGVVLNTTDPRTRDGYYETVSEVRWRLLPGTSYKTMNRKIEDYLDKHPELTHGKKMMLCLYPYKDFHSYAYGGKYGTSTLILLGAGVLVLLAAMFNYVLFMTGRIINRQKECGVRQIAGAENKAIFRMFVVEISLVMAIVLVLSLAFTEILSQIISQTGFRCLYFRQEGNLIWELGKHALQYAVFIWGVMLLVCWFTLKRVKLFSMYNRLQGGELHYRPRVQNVLLGIQLAICIFFAGGAYFLYAQQNFLEERIAGQLTKEEKGQIYSFNLGGEKLTPIRQDFGNMVKSNPYIRESCRCGNSLFGPWQLREKQWKMEGIKEEDKLLLHFMYIDPDYPSFIHAGMEEGRFFAPGEMNAAVVNREFARRVGFNPLGKEIAVEYFDPMTTYRIVGIIEDIVSVGANPVTGPCIYLPYPDAYPNLTYYVKLADGVSPEVLKPLEEKMREQVSPFTRINISNLDDDVEGYLWEVATMKVMTWVISAVCIVICLLGIYSSMMLAVEKRSREMAIRKINGAALWDIARIFGQHYFLLLLVAALIAFPVLYRVVAEWLEGYNMRITISWLPFAGIFGLIGGIVFLTILSQLIKVVKVNPGEALKSEK